MLKVGKIINGNYTKLLLFSDMDLISALRAATSNLPRESIGVLLLSKISLGLLISINSKIVSKVFLRFLKS